LEGGEAHTTNNRMEADGGDLGAEALKKPAPSTSTPTAVRPSGHHRLIHGWKKNGWRTSDKKPVKNVDHVAAARRRTASAPGALHWVKGHAGHDANERATSWRARASYVFPLSNNHIIIRKKSNL